MPNININRRIVLVNKTNLLPETKEWLAVLPSKPASFVVNAVNTFIQTCKVDGNWQLLDRFWLFAQDIQANAVYSIVNPTSTACTQVNSPTWTQYQGYTGNGSNMYLNTNFAPNSGTNFLKNSNSGGVYVRTNVTENKIDFGGNSPNYYAIYSNLGGNISSYNFENLGGSTGVPTAIGLSVISRTISTSYLNIKNGVTVSTPLRVSGSPNGLNIWVLALNNLGLYSSKQVSLAFVGGGGIDQLKFYNAVLTLKSQIGF